MHKNARSLKKLFALVMTLCLCLSLMNTVAFAAETKGDTGEPAAPVLTAEEKEEQELWAKALVGSLQYLKLNVTELNLKAGEEYTVKLIPAQLAQLYGWRIDKDNTKTSNAKYLSVQSVSADGTSITFKAEKSGYRVSLSVKLANATLNEMVAQNPALATYAKTVQNKTLTCKVATNNTGTKVVAGVGVKAPSSTGGGSSYVPGGGSGGNSGGNIPTIPVIPSDPCKDGHKYENGVCTVCGAKDPDYKPVTPPPHY